MLIAWWIMWSSLANASSPEKAVRVEVLLYCIEQYQLTHVLCLHCRRHGQRRAAIWEMQIEQRRKVVFGG